MSQYTDSMVAELTSTASFNYDSASQFAEAHSLSVRSVISKVKSLGLDYTPRPAVRKTVGERITKAQIVQEIASAVNGDVDAFAGLAKADMASLVALRKAL